MRIGIMSAMPEENAWLLPKILNGQKSYHAKREFKAGSLFGHEVVITFSRWGKVAAAITASHLIQDFKVDVILFTGVAGACSPHIRVGDVVVGKSFIQHDMDARPFYSQYEIPLMGVQQIPTCAQWCERTYQASKKFIEVGAHTERLAHFGIVSPAVYQGTIASGDKFFASKKEIDELNSRLPEVLCVEMEGAAVAQACYEYDIPCIVIRTISDDSSENSPKDFSLFVSSIASYYSAGIIEAVLKELPTSLYKFAIAH